MTTFLTIVYIFVCLFLILVVLFQPGKGGGMGSAFGGSGSQTVFGGAGAGNFLTKLTVISAMLFMVLSATLAYLSSSTDKSLERASETVQILEETRKEASKTKKTDETAEPAGMSLADEENPSEPEEKGAKGSDNENISDPVSQSPKTENQENTPTETDTE